MQELQLALVSIPTPSQTRIFVLSLRRSRFTGAGAMLAPKFQARSTRSRVSVPPVLRLGVGAGGARENEPKGLT